MNHLPAAIFLSIGLLILSTSILLPASAKLDEEKKENYTLKQQLAAYNQNKQKFQTLHTAVINKDPLVIEKIAFQTRKLKPEGSQTPDKIIDPLLFHPKIIKSKNDPKNPQPHAPFQSQSNLAFSDQLTQPIPLPNPIKTTYTAKSRIAKIIENPISKTILSLIGLSCIALTFIFNGKSPFPKSSLKETAIDENKDYELEETEYEIVDEEEDEYEYFEIDEETPEEPDNNEKFEYVKVDDENPAEEAIDNHDDYGYEEDIEETYKKK